MFVCVPCAGSYSMSTIAFNMNSSDFRGEYGFERYET